MAATAARIEAPLRQAPAQRRTARRPGKERRVAGGVIWIAVVGTLLAGVVAINVAVLRLKVEADHLGQQKVSLIEKKAQLDSRLSSAAATSRIQDAAQTQLGLVPASPNQTVYLRLKP